MLSSLTSRRNSWVAGLALMGGSSLACGSGTVVELGTRQAAIEGGEIDESTTNVFRVLTRASGFESLCSATLIAPQLMLTARHCIAKTNPGTIDCDVDRFGTVIPVSEVKFSNATEPDLFSTWFDAVHIVTSDESDFTCGYDIALVVLEQPVPASVAIPAEPRFVPQILTGEMYTAVGYGASNADESQAEFGIRHSRDGLAVACGQDRTCEAFVTDREFIGAGGACHGDSGGPALDAEGRVIGVLSRGAEGCNSPVYTGVPAYQALLIAAAQRAQTTFGIVLPVWAGGEEPIPVEQPEATSEPSDEDDADETFVDDMEADAGARREHTKLRETPGCSLSSRGTSSSSIWPWDLMTGVGLLLFVGRRRRGQKLLVDRHI